MRVVEPYSRVLLSNLYAADVFPAVLNLIIAPIDVRFLDMLMLLNPSMVVMLLILKIQ